MRKSLFDYCKETGMECLLAQWDQKKNMNLTPADISYGSKNKVWWRCEKGHEWQACVCDRVRGKNCPVCANRVIQAGENDLGTTHPKLACEWHPEKNKDLTPADVSSGSREKVWWQCGKGHEWRASVTQRTFFDSGCPYCAGRKVLAGFNDLASVHPEIAEQWHPTRNESLTAQKVTAGSRTRVWWRCEKGHEWQAKVSTRTSMGSGCPVCAGKVILPGENDFASRFPELAKEWHPTKNESWKPETVAPYSNRVVWWRCSLGHEWRTSVTHRTSMGYGCPYCAGRKVLAGFNDLETKYPQVAAQWHPTLNEDLTPQMVTVSSNKKVWWECADGHVWKTVIYSRTGPRGRGCPVCAGMVRKDQYRRYAEMSKGTKEQLG